MRKILLAAITTVILFSACQKSDSNCGDPANPKDSKAKIIGRDLTKCSCCGGWIIEIENVTYKFDKAPTGSIVNLDNLSYPALVNVTWHPLPGGCGRIDLLTLTQ